MPPRNHKGRPRLQLGLDRDVHQAIRKLVDEQDDLKDPNVRLTVAVAYDWIKQSNSRLGRVRKNQLEDSIERVIAVIKEDSKDNDDSGSIDGDFEGIEDQHIPDLNSMNMALRKTWAANDTPKLAAPVELNGSISNIASPRPGSPSRTTHSRKRAANGEPPKKRRKTQDRAPPTHVSLADLGGVDDVIEDLSDLLVLPMTRPEIYISSKVQPPRGILLHGPPGCGKTLIVNAFAAEIGVPFINISAPSIVSGMSGESEKALREHFEEAKQIAPCIIFIDEIDAITPKRENSQREMEKRIVAQLLTCMDDLSLEKTDGKCVMVLAATNRPDSLDPALRRGGRFDKEINMSVPNEQVREKILRALTRHMALDGSFDYAGLAKRTPGFVGADLNDLVSTAGYCSIKRYLEELRRQSTNDMEIDDDGEEQSISPKLKELRRLIKAAKEPREQTESQVISITFADFETALPKIQPSSKREGFATVPDTTWENIGALEEVQEELKTSVVEPIRNPGRYEKVGITAPTGVLLWGPPGCGKTLLAKAVANESRANFISVKGPELLNKYVGESERAVRQVFVRARSSIPCIIFFDEFDALVPARQDSQSEATTRVVNTMLTELNGVNDRKGIYVIAATNRPDMIDRAILRSGRMENKIYVGLPGENERVEILRALFHGLPIQWEEDFAKIARECEGFSGADLESLLRRAGYAAIKRNDTIKCIDFETAKGVVRPSVTDMKKYERLRQGGLV
ncbi:MAG: hypothetical protein M1834_001905 [Cirrosporium novae-zelandiae]|nr:MAG: hypothetical protein M1834_001905 [Cirrosporium novae-zelandiae]